MVVKLDFSYTDDTLSERMANPIAMIASARLARELEDIHEFGYYDCSGFEGFLREQEQSVRAQY